jgi:hypothetical protein
MIKKLNRRPTHELTVAWRSLTLEREKKESDPCRESSLQGHSLTMSLFGCALVYHHRACCNAVRFEQGFLERGFNYAEGCKFIRRTHELNTRQAKVFLTYRQLLKEECGDVQAAKKRVERAKACTQLPGTCRSSIRHQRTCIRVSGPHLVVLQC